MSAQKPLELILARNLLSSLSTPAFLVSEHGALLFYNEAAGAMLGRRFEDSVEMSADEWTSAFGPLADGDQAVAFDDIPATTAVRQNRPYHGRFQIRVAGSERRTVAASTIPIVGASGSTGAIVFFWPVDESEAFVEDEEGRG
jgi:PAS domain-containing protein